MTKCNFAILATGSMAGVMASAVQLMPHVALYAVGSHSIEKAQDFANKYGIEKAYGSYEEVLADPKVDLVYIATPHSHHLEVMEQCIAYNKPFLCEKAFTVNAEQARTVLAKAKSKNVFAAEAIWPRYMPMADTLREFYNSGRIGRITSLTANLAYPVYHRQRLHDPVLAGGALLDVGIYPLTFAAIMLGSDPIHIASDVQLSEEGVDMQSTVVLTYADNVKATLYSSIINASDRLGAIYGTEGYALVGNVNNYEYLDIYDLEHKLVEHISCPKQLTGYEYEIDACIKAMEDGKLECSEMPHSETVAMMELMDRIRKQWGLKYPCE